MAATKASDNNARYAVPFSNLLEWAQRHSDACASSTADKAPFLFPVSNDGGDFEWRATEVSDEPLSLTLKGIKAGQVVTDAHLGKFVEHLVEVLDELVESDEEDDDE